MAEKPLGGGETLFRVLQDGEHLFPGDARKPLQELINSRAFFEVFEERADRNCMRLNSHAPLRRVPGDRMRCVGCTAQLSPKAACASVANAFSDGQIISVEGGWIQVGFGGGTNTETVCP